MPRVEASSPSITTRGEMWLSAGGGVPSTTAGAASPAQTELATNDVNIVTVDFDGAGATEYEEWTVLMPADYNGGTVTARFQWTANSTSTNVVQWGLAGHAYANDDTMDAAQGTAQIILDANTATANQIHLSDATPAITLAGTPAASQLVQFKAQRVSGHADDTLAVDAKLLGVLVTYTRTGF